MKRKSVALGWVFAVLLAATPRSKAEYSAASQPEAKDHFTVGVEGKERELSEMRWITVSFPTTMVDEAVTGKLPPLPLSSPIVFDPPVEAVAYWSSPTEARIWIIPSPARVHLVRHRAALRKDLRDLAGQPVEARDWGIEFAAEEFLLREAKFVTDPAEDLDSPLSARPRVRLEFSRDMDPESVAKLVHFQDHENHRQYPIEVSYEERQPKAPQGWMFIEPVEPLPVGRVYTLVIDRLHEPAHQAPLPHLRVFPAGSTMPLLVEGAGGFNQPGRAPFARVYFNQKLEAGAGLAEKVSVAPAVGDLKVRAAGRTLEIEGSFDRRQRYSITLKPGMVARSGYPLAEARTLPVSFKAKRPAVILPQRDLFLRMSAGVKVRFQQVNTGELTWRLAELPAEQIPAAYQRAREFFQPLKDQQTGDPKTHPVTGEWIFRDTQLLIPALGLKVVGEGRFPASGDDLEVTREIQWRPTNSAQPAGLYLLEISGTANQRLVGNRSIVSCSDWVITRRESLAGTVVRVRSMIDGSSVPKLAVKALAVAPAQTAGVDMEPREPKAEVDAAPEMTVSEGETDEQGEAVLEGDTSPRWIVVGPPGAQCLQPTDLPEFPDQPAPLVKDEERKGRESAVRTVIFTDRDVYQPGDLVHFQVITRDLAKDGRLLLPKLPEDVEWTISLPGDEPKTKTASLRPSGSFSESYQLPGDVRGEGTISVRESQTTFKIAEVRPPTFEVDCEVEDIVGTSARLEVSSMYFHGAPNADAEVRWHAEWVADAWSSWNRFEEMQREVEEASTDPRPSGPAFAAGTLVLTDEQMPDPARGYSPDVSARLASKGWDVTNPDRTIGVSARAGGEGRLNKDGRLVINCPAPFREETLPNRALIFWSVEVVSADGRTIRKTAESRIQAVPQVPGIRLDVNGPRMLGLVVGSFDGKDQPAQGLPVQVQLFRLSFKTVKERLGERFQRYRNTPVLSEVWKGELTTPARRDLPVEQPGIYIARAAAPKQPRTAPCSAVAFLDGSEPVEVPVDNETSLAVRPVRPDRPKYRVGETAQIQVEAPFPGVATITLETDQTFARWTRRLDGNAQRLEVPLQNDSLVPNAFVTVHLLKTAGPGELAAERFGTCELRVERPETTLVVQPRLVLQKVEPGKIAQGVVEVRSQGKPVKDAEVLLFAVNEAWLALGDWKVPNLVEQFFPSRKHQFRTFTSLGNLWNPATPGQLTHYQKGFIVGDRFGYFEKGGPADAGLYIRRQSDPLATWQPGLRTNPQGQVAFEFKTLDALTSYRVVAVAHAGAERFGQGESKLVVSRELQAEAALPFFTRAGDEVELRVIVRQRYAPEDEIEVRCTETAGFELLGPPSGRHTVRQTAPEVFSFRARVAEGIGASECRAHFSARSVTDPERQGDDFESRLPIHSPVAEVWRVATGTASAQQPFLVPSIVPPEWSAAGGRCDLLLSHSRALPKLAGLPHLFSRADSLEEVSTRLLASLLFKDVLASLPTELLGSARLEQLIDSDIDTLSRPYQLSGLPLWPNGGERHDLTTIQAAWAGTLLPKEDDERGPPLSFDQIILDLAVNAGIDPEADLSRAQRSAPLQPFAMYVLAQALERLRPGDQLRLVAAAAELSRARDLLTDPESRAWLALTLHRLHILPAEKADLLRSLDVPAPEQPFAPDTFKTPARAEAIRLFAQIECAGTALPPAKLKTLTTSLGTLLDSSATLSHQENLWALLAFRTFLQAERATPLDLLRIAPPPKALSPNKVTAVWLAEPLNSIGQRFATSIRPAAAATWLLRAQCRVPAGTAIQVPGLAIERSLRNLTAEARTGAANAPLRIGDQVLVTFRLRTDRVHCHLAITDEVPACFETVNPDLPIHARHLRGALAGAANFGSAEHQIMDLARTKLFFSELPKGSHDYSVLARVIAAGSFQWPGTVAETLYDHRFSSVSMGSMLHATGP